MAGRKPGAILDSEYDIMRALAAEPSHTYGLAKTLGKGQTTIGGIVRRLERGGFLRSTTEADQVSDGRYRPPRRVYRLTAKGRRALRDAGGR